MLSALTTLSFFFFNDTATTEIYTLSLHDALPISGGLGQPPAAQCGRPPGLHHVRGRIRTAGDRKSTRLNSSHSQISYAVFCLKKKKTEVFSRPSSKLRSSISAYHLSAPAAL